jgi:serine kinase of HPr protein (carbohydrate metabolism regulator)
MMMAHATCIAFDGQAVLLRGPTGCGKSDLALRAIAAGARLVADDQVTLAARDGQVLASAPPALRGLIEIRGLGIVRLESEDDAPVALVADLTAAGEEIERMPEWRSCELLGIGIPLLALAAFEASAPTKLRFALSVAADPERLVR